MKKRTTRQIITAYVSAYKRSVRRFVTVYAKTHRGVVIALTALLSLLPLAVHIVAYPGTLAGKVAQPSIAILLFAITVVIVSSVKKLNFATAEDFYRDLEHPLWSTFEKVVFFLLVSILVQMYSMVFTADKDIFWLLYFTLGALVPIL